VLPLVLKPASQGGELHRVPKARSRLHAHNHLQSVVPMIGLIAVFATIGCGKQPVADEEVAGPLSPPVDAVPSASAADDAGATLAERAGVVVGDPSGRAMPIALQAVDGSTHTVFEGSTDAGPLSLDVQAGQALLVTQMGLCSVAQPGGGVKTVSWCFKAA